MPIERRQKIIGRSGALCGSLARRGGNGGCSGDGRPSAAERTCAGDGGANDGWLHARVWGPAAASFADSAPGQVSAPCALPAGCHGGPWFV